VFFSCVRRVGAGDPAPGPAPADGDEAGRGSLWQDRTSDRVMRLIALSYDNVNQLESVAVASPHEAREGQNGAKVAEPTKPTPSVSEGDTATIRRFGSTPRVNRKMRSLDSDHIEPPAT
jgi:hypothetical protein